MRRNGRDKRSRSRDNEQSIRPEVQSKTHQRVSDKDPLNPFANFTEA